ncbi:MAG: DUF2806 domain-containing protein [Deltaproteobacteria bacterium]|nr:DUF2806 domain-containing protein [Deltaproteobacteria bacterium]MCL4874310.1 DUF2806 domain-containing protein [bacterium]
MKFPCENLLIKLWETLSEKGIGSLLGPWQTRRMGCASTDVRVQEKLALAQAEKYVEEIRSGRMTFSKGQLIAAPTSSLPDKEPKQIPDHVISPKIDYGLLLNMINSNNAAENLRREINISKALLQAEEELEQNPQEPMEKNIDEDWLYRWRDYASNVSVEELQSIWGRLLAGEIKAPGSFSLRTLDFLKSISKSDAESITNLLRFAIANVVFRGDKELLNNENLTFDFLLEMQELGLISGVETSLESTFNSVDKNRFVVALLSHGKVLVAKHDDPIKKLKLKPICKISTLGQQILNLGKFEPHEKYLHKVGESIKNQGFEIELADYVKISSKLINYSNAKKI